MLPQSKQLVVVVNVGVPVAPVQSIAPIRGMFCVTVCEALNALSMRHVSCGNGTRDVQLPIVQKLPLVARVQCCVVASVKTMPVFHPQSPLHPVIAERFQFAAPAALMSWKSTFEKDTAAAVMVLCTLTPPDG